ncbi:hypothetical protein MNBD_GAMMA12-2591 [hydrothermal vent metagenome]|uniref:Uncharacterized protein n=1 Tax=hydrothermal vent metagenome TaxID=652676 RepID=A0A3B0Y7U6_9ZZZZ
MRFHFHISFITVVVAAFSYSPVAVVNVLPMLLLCYLVFNVLIYGGLYTFNDIIDAKADSQHPIKKMRAIPAGKVSVVAAANFSALLILSGISIAYYYLSSNVFSILLLFIGLNFAYTLYFKHIIYLNLAIVAGTHTLRLLLGITLVDATISPGVLIAFYCLLFGIATTIHSLFNLKPYEEPYYTKYHVLFIQLASFLIVGLLQFYSNYFLSLPVVALEIFYLVLIICSYASVLQPYIARVFMVKLKNV